MSSVRQNYQYTIHEMVFLFNELVECEGNYNNRKKTI